MAADEHSLSSLVLQQELDAKLERNFLKDRAADVLRDYISTGVIPEGTKLTEREVSHLLGISRMPVHDALIILETEGLVVRRGNLRYVVQLDEYRIMSLYVVRRALELEAVMAAAKNASSKDGEGLYDKLAALELAEESEDHRLSAKRDMALHQEIWKLADNEYLLDILNSLVGLLFVLNDRIQSIAELRLHDQGLVHREIVDCIVSGDAKKACQAMDAHLSSALDGALVILRMADRESD